MTLEGFEPLKRAIVRAPELVRAHSSDVVASSTFATFNRARVMVPVDTGGLRMALDWNARGLSGRVVINPGAFYWRFVEYGTVRMAARPFLRPAAEQERQPFIDGMRKIGPKLERDWSTNRFI